MELYLHTPPPSLWHIQEHIKEKYEKILPMDNEYFCLLAKQGETV